MQGFNHVAGTIEGADMGYRNANRNTTRHGLRQVGRLNAADQQAFRCIPVGRNVYFADKGFRLVVMSPLRAFEAKDVCGAAGRPGL